MKLIRYTRRTKIEVQEYWQKNVMQLSTVTVLTAMHYSTVYEAFYVVAEGNFTDFVWF